MRRLIDQDNAHQISYDTVIRAVEAALATPDAADSQTGKPAPTVWESLKKAVDINFYKPQTRPDILVEPSNAGGEEHFILKEPKRGLYIQIAPEDHYIYQLMDGSRTVVDLVVAYCMKYKVIAQTRVLNFVQSLRGFGLLAEQFYSAYDDLQLKLARRTPKYWTDQILKTFLTRRQIAIGGIDRFIGLLYRKGVWVFYTRPVVLLMVVIALIGSVGFGALAIGGQYSVLGNQESAVAGLATLAVLQIISIVLHECAHAFTLKHFKREVRRAGLLFYLGLLGAFVDTTDIWYEGKWKRLAVTAAGPIMNLFLGGTATLIILARADPSDLTNGLLYQFALAQYLMVAFNAAPFIKLDGYYLLTDLFGIPSLRERALTFLTDELPKRAAQAWQDGYILPKLSREEKLMTVYGTVVVLWTANLFMLGVLLAPVQFVNLVKQVFSGADLGRLILPLGFITSLLLGFLPQIFSLARQGLDRLARLARSQPAWQVFPLLAGIAIVATALPLYVASESPMVAALYARLLTTAATVAATAIAMGQVRLYRQSRWRTMFVGLALSAGLVAAFNLIELFFPKNEIVNLQSLSRWHLISLMPAAAGIALRVRLLARSLLAELRWVWALTSIGTACMVVAALLPPPTFVPHLIAQFGQFLWCAGLFLHWHLTRRGLPYQPPVLVKPEILAGDAQTQAKFALKWIGERVVAASLAAHGRQALLQLASKFNRDNAAKMRRVWLTMEGELGVNPKGDWVTVQANWRLVLDDLLNRFAAVVGDKLAQSAIYEAMAQMPRPIQAAGLSLLEGSQWAEGLDVLVNADGDRIYLRRAFIYLGEQMLQACSRTYGWLLTDSVIAQFNRMAVAHRWGVWLRVPGKFDNRIGFTDVDIITSQRLYREALSGLITCLMTIMGHAAIYKALTRARDSLPWMQREIADSLLLMNLEENATRREQLRLNMLHNVIPHADHAVLPDLARRAVSLTFRAGTEIARQGQPAAKLLIMMRGRAQVIRKDAQGVLSVEAELHEGDTFAREAILTQAPLHASLQAVTDVEVLTLHRADLPPYLDASTPIGHHIDRLLLRRIPVFRDLSSEWFQTIVAALHIEEIAAGHNLIEQGYPVGGLYIIQAGRFEVWMGTDSDQRQVATLGPGEVCGEQSLLTGSHANATVQATEPSIVLRLDGQDFHRLVHEQQTVTGHLEQVKSRRVLTTREPLVIGAGVGQ